MLVLSQLPTRAATRRAPCVQRVARHRLRPLNKPRTLVTEAIQQASDGFLDLAIAIPYPEYIPPYSGTIILLTIATRLVFTVPFSIWVCSDSTSCRVVLIRLLGEEAAMENRRGRGPTAYEGTTSYSATGAPGNEEKRFPWKQGGGASRACQESETIGTVPSPLSCHAIINVQLDASPTKRALQGA